MTLFVVRKKFSRSVACVGPKFIEYFTYDVVNNLIDKYW